MGFPVVSTSVETVRIARAAAVMNRRRWARKRISRGEVYNCKTDSAGPPPLYSAHAFGDAVDLMCSAGPEALSRIAHRAVQDATSRTFANRGRRTEVIFVIFEREQWTKEHGWQPYTGVPHTDHVHVACSYSTVHVPACAGGTNYPVPYVHG